MKISKLPLVAMATDTRTILRRHHHKEIRIGTVCGKHWTLLTHFTSVSASTGLNPEFNKKNLSQNRNVFFLQFTISKYSQVDAPAMCDILIT